MKLFRVFPIGILFCFVFSLNALGSLPFDVDLSQTGFEILGIDANDETGYALAMADVDGDTYSDLLISAPHADGTGVVYLVFGSEDFGTGAQLDLSDLATDGVVITGEMQDDLLGWCVLSLGDLNSDGKDDILISAPGYDLVDPAQEEVGRCYLIYGKERGEYSETLNLSDPGAADLTIDGNGEFDSIGLSLGMGGNFGGDDFPVSLLIGAPLKNLNNWADGAAYVVYWDAGMTGSTDMDTLLGEGKCLQLEGSLFFENAGISVAGGFDFNDDGYGDIMLGAPGAATTSYVIPGTAYLIYGAATALTGSASLATLHGAEDRVVAFNGASDYEQTGYSVAGIANAYEDSEKFDSIAISAPLASPNGVRSGRVYVIQGSVDFTDFTVELDDPGSMAYTLNGIDTYDGHLGYGLTALGDINDDGNGDFAVGVSYATPGTQPHAGAVHVVLGSRFFHAEEELGSLVPKQPMISGAAYGDFCGCAVACTGDVNGDDLNDMIVGSRGYSSGIDEYIGRAHFLAGTNTAMGTKGDINMSLMPYIDLRGDLSPGSAEGFDAYFQVDTAWSQQASGLFYGLIFISVGIFDDPGQRYQNITIWPDLFQPGTLPIWLGEDAATGEVTLSGIIMPASVPSGSLIYVQKLWQNPSSASDLAASNCMCIEVP